MTSVLDCPKCGKQLKPHCPKNYACSWLRCTRCVVIYDTEGKAHEDFVVKAVTEKKEAK